MVELKVPTVGESITEVQIGDWLKGEGEFVEKDQPVVEIESDKATVEVSAPVSGTISKVMKRKGERATVGEVIGQVEESAAPVAKTGAAEQGPSSKPADAPQRAPVLGQASAELAGQIAPQAPSPEHEKGEPWVVPAARRALAEHGLKAEEVQASGRGGRLVKEDVDRYLQRAKETAHAPVAVPQQVDASHFGGEDEIVPLSPLRRRVAERLVEAQQTAALLTTFNEIDMAAVMDLRQRHRETFQDKHGVKLGFMSFFVKATIEALKRFPQVNAEIRGTDVVYHNYYDIGIAVGGGKGLVVPVLRGADRMSFAELEKAIADFGQRARDNKVKIDELRGGTFTISNGGVYGSLLSTPIVNPPQSGILGLHAIQERPVAREGQVVIRPMMYVALTYDHRLVDGREAVLFLRHIKELIEEPSRILLEI
ncbi:MAG TPA: 2-oxoglutarate dehydrogenase complex dihydrolipoyllysine-residue succinyltransferase [Pirellulales bacterium]|jgi:2-oxoglutarate dehydrogenase E2 component (dihydrolipoamide succinyltransferase)|nr:2-oxoglutarate dehydrogenase complex dihydrolipoyllysine-residue succinyltransferase [Pirellulales bacterium]